MLHVYILYKDLRDLLSKFQKLNFNNHTIHKKCNFVIISESLYNGCYGGIFSNTLIKEYKSKGYSFIYDRLTTKLGLVWWNNFCSKRGDMSLRRNEYVLVTKKMFGKMKKRTIFKPIKSSYIK